METYSGCEGDGYTVDVNGNTYDETNPTGTETFTGGAASGCDSIVTIDLEFNTVTTTTDEVTACETYTWIDGTTYTQNNNTATHTLTSSNGCDSIINLDLTIESTLDLNVTTVVNSNDMIVLIADQDNASYQWLDCDDNYAVIPGENNQTFDPSVNGNYAVSVSTISCADTSNCVDVTTVSTEKEELVDIKVFPNPSKGKFTVSGYTDNNGSIEVIDAMGRNIKSLNITSTSTDVNLQDNQKGIYFFKVIQNNEEFIHKVIVN
ncbi:MAG: T9SS type A sorting domain-containing protein, partial [Brumimicrobium sp.]